MGAIFNTQGTRTILNFLNVHYGPGAQFDHARTSAVSISAGCSEPSPSK